MEETIIFELIPDDPELNSRLVEFVVDQRLHTFNQTEAGRLEHLSPQRISKVEENLKRRLLENLKGSDNEALLRAMLAK